MNQAVQVGLACLLFVAPNSTPSSRTFSLVKSHLREFTKGAAFLPHSHHPNFLPNTGLQMSKFKSCFPGNNSDQWIAKLYGLVASMFVSWIFSSNGNFDLSKDWKKIGNAFGDSSRGLSDSFASGNLYPLMVFPRCLLESAPQIFSYCSLSTGWRSLD